MVDPGESLAGDRTAPFRKFAIVAVVIGVVGSGWWIFGRGKGQPEDPARVLIIGPTPELAEFLDHEGFDPEFMSFGAAIGEGKAHDPSLEDLAAVIEHADQMGIGYVALDLVHGETYDFAGAGYDPGERPPGSTFAVLAVGKLGKHVSYGGVVPGIHHEPPADEEVGLLFALFGQRELDKARTNDAINDLMVRFGAEGTMEDLRDYEKAQTNMRRQITAWENMAKRETRPADSNELIELARPYERLVGWPLASGAILLGSGRDAWHSKNGLVSEWSGVDLRAELSVVSIDSAATLADRSPCTTLPDTLQLDGGFVLGPGGDALLIPSDRWVADLWVLGEGACGFEQRSPIRRLANGEFGKPRPEGRTAEAIGGELMWADAKMQAYRTLAIPGVSAYDHALAWMSGDVVALPVSLDFAAAAEYRASALAPSDPETIVEPSPAIDPSTSSLPDNRDALLLVRLPSAKQKDAIEVAVIPVAVGESVVALTPIASDGVAIVQLDGPRGSKLSRVKLPLAELRWSQAGSGFDLAAAINLNSREFEPVATLPERIVDLTISPSGTTAAWTAEFDEPPGEDPLRAYEIVTLVFGGEPKRQTVNEFADIRPRFVGTKGELLIFESTRTAAEDLPAITTLRALRL